MLIRWIAIVLALVLPVANVVRAELRADQLLLVTNKNDPESIKLAQYYAEKRAVPDGRIVELDLPISHAVSMEQFDTGVADVIRKFLKDHQLEDDVRCIVTFYGVPHHVEDRKLSAEAGAEVEQLRRDISQVIAELRPLVVRMEVVASSANPTYRPPPGESVGELLARAQAANQAVEAAISRMSDGPQRQKIIADRTGVIQQLSAPARLPSMPATRATERGRDGADLTAMTPDQLYSRMTDPASRQRLREIMHQQGGKIGLIRALEAQIAFLDSRDTASSMDNELALLWWGSYARQRWQLNPMHWRANVPANSPRPLMVARIDAPDPASAKRMIDHAVQVEKTGLTGKVVLDGRGLRSQSRNDGFAVFDESIRRLANLLKSKTRLEVVYEDTEALIPANSQTNIAIYCGWYSVDKYVPPGTFAPGATGYHVASFTMGLMRAWGPPHWVPQLIRDGLDATMGPCSEPYLHAFPAPDEFFPLLLTGKLTLAEVYWATMPMTSWRMSLVGDPLYKPFAANPALSVDDLPEGLRRVTERP
jgi:uncharacterized protein (TIGR03790 family)